MRYQSKKIVVAINFAALGAAAVSFLLIRSAIAQTATTSPAEISEAVTQLDVSTTTVDTALDPALSGLREVHIIGTKYTDYFSDGSKLVDFPGDPNIHANIAKANAPTPSHEGLTWDHSVGTYLYDTPSGDLEIGTFAQQPNGSYVAHFATTTIENATSTPFLPARIVVLQERPATATPTPASASEQNPPENNTRSASGSSAPAQPEAGSSNASDVPVENAASSTVSEGAPEPPAQAQEVGQVLGTTTEETQTSQGELPVATGSAETE